MHRNSTFSGSWDRAAWTCKRKALEVYGPLRVAFLVKEFGSPPGTGLLQGRCGFWVLSIANYFSHVSLRVRCTANSGPRDAISRQAHDKIRGGGWRATALGYGGRPRGGSPVRAFLLGIPAKSERRIAN